MSDVVVEQRMHGRVSCDSVAACRTALRSARVTCSALHPDSSARWPASSRPASVGGVERRDRPSTRRRRSASLASSGCVLIVGEQVVERALERPAAPSARSGRASRRRAMKSSRRRRSSPPCIERQLGQVPGGLDELRIVQRHQRLQRRVGPLAADGAGLAAGGVEDVQRGRRRGPLPERVQAAAIEVLAACRAGSRGCCCRSWRRPPRRRRADTA